MFATTSRSSAGSSVGSMTEARLLPPFALERKDSTSPVVRSPSQVSLQPPPPPRSPSQRSFPTPRAPPANPLRSPTLAASTAAARPPRSPSAAGLSFPRPSSTVQSTTQRRAHVRSQSAASLSSLSSVVSGRDEHDSPWQPDKSQFSGSTWASSGGMAPASPGSVRPPLAAVDWLVAAAEEDHDHVATNVPYGRLSSGSAGQASAVSSAESGGDGLQKEAKVDRRIADLEIRNASLLTINADLERLKVKHRKEIRDLRRKLRESIGGAGLAALRAQMSHVDEGIEDDADEDGSGFEDGADGVPSEPEPTWPEILEGDPAFSAVAAALEGLLGRAKRAVAYEPAGADLAGRVLSAVEVEEQFAGQGDPASTSTSASASDTEDSRPRTLSRSSSTRGLAIEGWPTRRRPFPR